MLSQEVKGQSSKGYILYSQVYVKTAVITSETEANEAKG